MLRLLRCEPLGADAAEASTGKAAAAAAAAAAVELACCRGEGAPQWGALLARHCAPMGDQPGGLAPGQAPSQVVLPSVVVMLPSVPKNRTSCKFFYRF